MKTKTMALFSLFFLFSGWLWSQSLAELAKKERERRESLKEKKTVVITNDDLARVKRKPALETGVASVERRESATAESVDQAAPPQPASRVMPVTIDQASPSLFSGGAATEQQGLEEKYQKAKEYVELLTLKLNALWQEFYSLDDMTPRDQIQQAIAETFLKLQKAQEDEDKARQELEKYLSRVKKESAPSIWIR
jgi:hypothetical protein